MADVDEKFPTRQLFVLAICRLAEPIAFTSIMAYTFVMVKTFPEVNESNASFYSGLLVSAFAVAEACTAMSWGVVSDRYGRKPVILFGLAGTALSSIIFGFAKNIWIALGARVVGGLLNGNVAVMQTMVAEMCKKPEWEPRAYAMPPFMWSLGTILGAAMGGYLAEPARYYPSIFSEDGLFGKYPYLLPNLIAVVFIILAIIQGYLFLEETNPNFQSQPQHEETITERTPLNPRARRQSVTDILSTGKRRPSFVCGSMPTVTEPGFDLRRNSVTTMHDIKPVVQQVEDIVFEEDDEEEHAHNSTVSMHGQSSLNSTPVIKAFNRKVVLWIVGLIIFCYHQMAYAAILPIWFLDLPSSSSNNDNNSTVLFPTPPPPTTHPATLDLHGGLGFTVHAVGSYMSVNGIIALLIQALIFPPFLSRVGVRNSLTFLTLLMPITYLIFPFLTLLQGHPHLLPAGIYLVLTIQNFFMIVIYPCLLIALKDATPSSTVLGRVNGLAMSATSGARTVAPPVAGIVYSGLGSAGAWWVNALIALLGGIECLVITRLEKKEGNVKETRVEVESVLGRKPSIVAPTGGGGGGGV